MAPAVATKSPEKTRSGWLVDIWSHHQTNRRRSWFCDLWNVHSYWNKPSLEPGNAALQKNLGA